MPDKKLFVDGHALEDMAQGVSRYIAGLCCAYAGLFPDTTIHVGLRAPQGLPDLLARHKNICAVPYPSRHHLRNLNWFIPRYLRSQGIGAAVLQYMRPLRHTAKYIVVVHDLLFLEYPQLFPWLYRTTRARYFTWSARHADTVVAVSDTARLSVAQHTGLDPKAIPIVPNGISSMYFHQAGSTDDRDHLLRTYGITRYILCVSRWEPRKNQAILLKAYAALRLWRQAVHLVFIGSPTLPCPRYQQIYGQLPGIARQHVHSLRNVDQAALLRFYRNAAVCVYPSMAEGFGRPPLEAAAAGTPVLCSEVKPMSDWDFLLPGFFPPANADMLAGKLQACLEKPPDSYGLRAMSRRVKQEFDWARSACLLQEVVR